MQITLNEFHTDRTISVRICYTGDELSLCVDATELDTPFLWPAFTSLRRADELWRTTCLELFIADPESTNYIEINMSPSGAWQCYGFDSYRAGMRASDALRPVRIECDERGILKATLDVQSGLSDGFRVGPAAVIEYESGSIGYFAIGHGDQPDFHNPAFYCAADFPTKSV